MDDIANRDGLPHVVALEVADHVPGDGGLLESRSLLFKLLYAVLAEDRDAEIESRLEQPCRMALRDSDHRDAVMFS